MESIAALDEEEKVAPQPRRFRSSDGSICVELSPEEISKSKVLSSIVELDSTGDEVVLPNINAIQLQAIETFLKLMDKGTEYLDILRPLPDVIDFDEIVGESFSKFCTEFEAQQGIPAIIELMSTSHYLDIFWMTEVLAAYVAKLVREKRVRIEKGCVLDIVE